MIDRMMKPINDIYNRWVLHKNHVQCGRNLKVNGRVYVYGDILIGDSVSINSGFKYNPIGGQEFYIAEMVEKLKSEIMLEYQIPRYFQ